MARGIISAKRIQIGKANARIVLFVAGAAFVAAFCLVASRALLDQRAYQSRVIKEKTAALNQLQANNSAVDQLVNSYKSFVGEPINIISGTSSGSGDRDGDNAKIVLDALPSKYDFPALATSIEKILSNQKYTIDSITGTDDELNQQQTATGTETIEIPFQIGVSGDFASMQGLIDVLQRSIRPISINTIEMEGSDSLLKISISAKTYYQPEKTVNITTKDVK